MSVLEKGLPQMTKRELYTFALGGLLQRISAEEDKAAKGNVIAAARLEQLQAQHTEILHKLNSTTGLDEEL